MFGTPPFTLSRQSVTRPKTNGHRCEHKSTPRRRPNTYSCRGYPPTDSWTVHWATTRLVRSSPFGATIRASWAVDARIGTPLDLNAAQLPIHHYLPLPFHP
jgi:hypothetical protein